MTLEQHLSDPELDRRLAALPTESVPDPALWAGIEARLAPRRRTRLWAVAASAGGLALALAALMPMLQREPLADPGQIAIRAETRALQALEPAVQPTGISNAGLEGAWQDNQAAIAELEQALERTPGNRMLLDFLAQARLRQARLLGQAAAEDIIPTPTERSIET